MAFLSFTVVMATQPQSRIRERALAELAEQQHGVVSRRDLVSLGYRSGAITRRLQAGRLLLLHRGVYAVGRRPVGNHGRWMAAVLACGDGAVLSHRSAAVLWGLTRSEGPAVDVTSDHGRQAKSRIAVHRCKRETADLTVHQGVPVTTATRTLFDLAETVRVPMLRSAFEEADRLRLLEINELERIVERGRGRRALRPIRPMLVEARYAETRRSPLEESFDAFCVAQGLPSPVFNCTILGFEIDAAWPSHGLVAELDGFAYHHHRAAFERDRARDTALLIAGYRVIRLTHRRLLHEPDTVASQIRKLLDVSEVDSP